MKCIIVDDEPLAREILETFTQKVPALEVVASCKNAFEVLDILQKEKIDLIFLDIQMPDLNGIQLYESLNYKPLVIFTTAYSHYAVTGFDLEAVDYLVKPFSFERFLKAVNKAGEWLKKKTNAPQSHHNFMFVKDGTKMVKVDYEDVLYLEGMKDYVKIVMKDKYIMTLISMQQMAEKLPSEGFIRVHRSYIIPISKIDKIEKNRVVIGGKWIPVGNSFKEKLFDLLGKIG